MDARRAGTPRGTWGDARPYARGFLGASSRGRVIRALGARQRRQDRPQPQRREGLLLTAMRYVLAAIGRRPPVAGQAAEMRPQRPRLRPAHPTSMMISG